MWIQFHFYFKKKNSPLKRNYYLTKKQLNEFHYFLYTLVKKYNPKRKFFLFENKPDCFFSMELNSIPRTKKMVFPDFITRVLVKNSNETANGEPFLDVMNIMTDYILNLRDCSPFSEDFIGKVSHCAFNGLGWTRRKEICYYREIVKRWEVIF